MTTANPSLPENRIFFDPVHETAVNNFYSVMRESNANLDSIITYLRTTNTSITTNNAGQVGQGQPGAVTEALINTVKKLRDENKEVENKWSAYMALRGGVITHSNIPAPIDDFGDLAGVLETLKKIYKGQYEKITQDVHPAAIGGAGAAHEDPHLLEFVQVNLVYNQKKLYQAAKAMQINERTVSGLGDYIFSNALDLNDERDIFDFSNVM